MIKVCKKLFVFDWDGTIIDSMPTKFTNFSEVLAESINSVSSRPVLSSDVMSVYHEYSGLSRRFIFNKAIELTGCSVPIDYDRFSNALARKNIRDLVPAKIFEDAVRLLQRLHELDIPFCISSSAPIPELKQITNGKINAGFIPKPDHVLGSRNGFRKGRDHLNFLVNQYTNIDLSDIIFLGDEVKDYEVNSTVPGVTVFVVDRDARFNGADFPVIQSFDQLEICV